MSKKDQKWYSYILPGNDARDLRLAGLGMLVAWQSMNGYRDNSLHSKLIIIIALVFIMIDPIVKLLNKKSKK